MLRSVGLSSILLSISFLEESVHTPGEDVLIACENEIFYLSTNLQWEENQLAHSAYCDTNISALTASPSNSLFMRWSMSECTFSWVGGNICGIVTSHRDTLCTGDRATELNELGRLYSGCAHSRWHDKYQWHPDNAELCLFLNWYVLCV